jgi:hypothetical protein
MQNAECGMESPLWVRRNVLQAPSALTPRTPLSRALRAQERGANHTLVLLPRSCGRRPRERGLGGEGQRYRDPICMRRTAVVYSAALYDSSGD